MASLGVDIRSAISRHSQGNSAVVCFAQAGESLHQFSCGGLILAEHEQGRPPGGLAKALQAFAAEACGEMHHLCGSVDPALHWGKVLADDVPEFV